MLEEEESWQRRRTSHLLRYEGRYCSSMILFRDKVAEMEVDLAGVEEVVEVTEVGMEMVEVEEEEGEEEKDLVVL